MSVYSIQTVLRNKDVNIFRKLRTSRLFEMLQEVSIAHTEELGMGRHMTLDQGLLWVVVQQRAEISRMPEYDETITVTTWPTETMHVLFPRQYEVSDAEGNVIVKGSALWALVDIETRKMIFPGRHGIVIEGETTGREIELPEVIRPQQTRKKSEFTVPFSYCDLNRHMNNTSYFDLAEDLLICPGEGYEITEVSANYARECAYGDHVTVTWSEEEGNCFLSGDTEKNCFRMKLTYEKKCPE